MQFHIKLARRGIAFVACLLLALAGCSHKHAGSSNPILAAPVQQVAAEQRLPEGTSVAGAISVLKSAAVPEGISPALYEVLRAELLRQLSQRGADKLACGPPQSDACCVSDLALYGDEAAGYRLEWSYRNQGDYSQDGLVGIQDLTPIGLYFGKTQSAEDWSSAQLADGDGNGEVNIADITPIGQNFQAYCQAYRVYSAASAEDTLSEVGDVPLPDKQPGEALLLSFDIPGSPAPLYWVAPLDDQGAVGYPSLPAAAPGVPAQVILGTETVDATLTIGAAGGTISGSAGSPVEQVSVEFPAGALAADTEVQLGYNSGSVIPADGRFVGPILTLDAAGVSEFIEPVLISIPYTADDGYLPLLYDVGEDGQVEVLQLCDLNDASGRATFLSFHASSKAEIDAKATFATFDAIGAYSCNFQVRQDNFQIRNMGSTYSPGGECFGMTAWSLWYYRYHARNEGQFYPRFMDPVDGLSGQDLIATRAHISIHRQLQSHYRQQARERMLVYGDYKNFCMLRGALLESRLPIPACACTPGMPVTHSILFLGYATSVWNRSLEPGGENIARYITCTFSDPNVPRHAKQAQYHLPQNASALTDLKFEGYVPTSSIYFGSEPTAFETVVQEGNGTLYLREHYENILADANEGFHSSRNATIQVTSHQSGANVTGVQTMLTGQVSSGEILVSNLGVYVNGTTLFHCDVPPTGEFSLPIKLYWGLNDLSFATAGYDALNNLVDCQNNLIQGFVLNGDFPAAQIAISSHANGADETHRLVKLMGQVNSPEAIERLDVTADFQPAGSATVQPDGSFTLFVRLLPEDNDLRFTTWIPDGQGGLMVYPNNLESNSFVLNGKFDYALVVITTTWEPADTLGGVVVWNANGAWHCAGGDSGCGGEYESADFAERIELFYFAEDDADIIYGQPYLVRPCFINDSRAEPDGPLRYKIDVVMYEGLPGAVKQSFSGSIDTAGILIGSGGQNDISGDGWGEPFSFTLHPLN